MSHFDGNSNLSDGPAVMVLGVAQDGGYPHPGCEASCCRPAWSDPRLARMVSSLAIVDGESRQRWIIDCTPDFPRQLHAVRAAAPQDGGPALDGLLLTHAHVGHYTGLIYLGREAMDAHGAPVCAMPRMAEFLRRHAPWSDLVDGGNIVLRPLAAGEPVPLNARVSVTPIPVRHRGEHSETVGFRIAGPKRSVLYLPDADAWEEGETDIESLLADVDAAFLDGTFFDEHELSGRDMSQVPHPTITDSLRRFGGQAAAGRATIHFIHFNHTNPVLLPNSQQAEQVRAAGCRLAEEGQVMFI